MNETELKAAPIFFSFNHISASRAIMTELRQSSAEQSFRNMKIAMKWPEWDYEEVRKLLGRILSNWHIKKCPDSNEKL